MNDTIQYAKVKLNEAEIYRYFGASNSEMDILAFFLTSDIGCYTPFFKNIILDDSIDFTNGNITVLYKEGNDILLGDLYSKREDEGPFLRVAKQELVALIEQWEQFCKTKPQEILIKFQNGKFICETK